MGATVIAAAAARAERQIVAHLRDAGATTPERATSLPEMRPLGRRRLERLISARVVLETSRGYWLDETAYADYRSDRRTIVIVIMAIIATAFAGVVLAKML